MLPTTTLACVADPPRVLLRLPCKGGLFEGEMATKRCSKCGLVKVVEEFHARNDSKDGLRSACKPCVRERVKIWQAANREDVCERQRCYRAAHLEIVSEGQRRWYVANRKDALERQRCWCAANPDVVREGKLRWRAANPEKVREHQRRYRATHLEERREQACRWRAANPDKTRQKEAKRRALKLNSPFVEHIDRAVLFNRDGGRCHICGKRVGKVWHLDHLIPLSKGGEHSYRNAAVAHPVCNLRRGNREPAQLRFH